VTLTSGIPAFSDVIAPLPGQNHILQNWVLVSTTFDTNKWAKTHCGDINLVFWVVVWMQDKNTGQLVAEMPGHGLTAIPGTLTSVADVPEEIQSGSNCPGATTQEPTCSYSNNVGMYQQVFYLAPSHSDTTCQFQSPVPGPPPVPGTGSLDIGKVQLSAGEITPAAHVTISATLLTHGVDSSGVSASFYDGDPQQGGRLFNTELVPHIAQNDPYTLQTLYRTNTCGVHQLFVVVNQGRPSEVVRRAPPLRVACTASR
jgi:hypothetical protein